MKKLLSILFLIYSGNSFGQGFPSNPTQGNPSTKNIVLGAWEARKGMVVGVYSDTSSANSDTYTKGVPYITITTTSGGNVLWQRNSTATQWLQMSGNTNSDSLRKYIPRAGTSSDGGGPITGELITTNNIHMNMGGGTLLELNSDGRIATNQIDVYSGPSVSTATGVNTLASTATSFWINHLPDKDGVLALSVNGNFAGTDGNIVMPVGGTDTAYIPIAGTNVVTGPVTGTIEFTGDPSKTFASTVNNEIWIGAGDDKNIDESAIRKAALQLTSVDSDNNKAGLFSQDAPNGLLSKFEAYTESSTGTAKVVISAQNPGGTSPGLTGEQDFTPFIGPLDYPQKKYVDSLFALGGGTAIDETIVATGGQTAFTFTTVPADYATYLIFINGSEIENTTYFTTSGNIVTFTTGLVAGDRVRYRRIK